MCRMESYFGDETFQGLFLENLWYEVIIIMIFNAG